jgi:hypothetical protein
MNKVWMSYSECKENIFLLPIENHPQLLYKTLLRTERPQLFRPPIGNISISEEDFGTGGSIVKSTNIGEYIKNTIEDKIIGQYFDTDSLKEPYYGRYSAEIHGFINEWLKANSFLGLREDVDILFEACRITSNQIFLTVLDKLPSLGSSFYQKLSKNKNSDSHIDLYIATRKYLYKIFQSEYQKVNEIWIKHEEAMNNMAFRYALHNYVKTELKSLEAK